MTSFRTKRGRCIIDDQSLYLTSSMKGLFRRYWEAGKLGKALAVFYLGFFGWFAYMLAFNFNLPFRAGLVAGLALLGIAYLVNYLRGFSTRSVIPLDSVEDVSLVEGRKGLTRPRFIIRFRQEGELKKRYVMMPSLWLEYGEEELEKAENVFRENGFRFEES